MRRRLAFIVIFSMVIIVAGCGGGSDDGADAPEAQPTAELFPLVFGNYWQYLVEDYTSTAQTTAHRLRAERQKIGIGFLNVYNRVSTAQDGEPGVAELFMTCNGEVPSDSSGWFEIGLAQNGQTVGALFLKHDSSGLLQATSDWHFDGGKLVVPDSYYRLRTPLEAGNEWQHEFSDEVGSFTDTFRIAAVDVTKTVQAGTFDDCVQSEETHEGSGGVLRVLTWFAPRVGVILSEEYVNDELTGTTELAAYSTQ